MLENGHIDKSGHANDAGKMYREVLSFDESAWRSAPAYSWVDARGAPVESPVTAKMLSDTAAETLYIGLRIPDKKIVGDQQTHDSIDVFDGDTVEIFLSSIDSDTYYQIAINTHGSVYDGKGFDSSWNADIDVATSIGRDEWTVELALPIKQFGFEAPPTVNFCRTDKPSGSVQNLSRTGGSFHNRAAHVALEFVE